MEIIRVDDSSIYFFNTILDISKEGHSISRLLYSNETGFVINENKKWYRLKNIIKFIDVLCILGFEYSTIEVNQKKFSDLFEDIDSNKFISVNITEC